MLVTDHHLPGDRLPAPAIIVNPNQPGCGFASKHIAGVGVMFYVLAATRAALKARGRDVDAAPPLASLLDLVALGTVADVVRLDRVNRILVGQGLKRIRAGRAHAGVAALFAVAGRDAAHATVTDLGFVAGPRVNAAGRLADMSIGIRCLVTDDPGEAHDLAARARPDQPRATRDRGDDLRRGATPTSTRSPPTRRRARRSARTAPSWHAGVVGIVASRLKDRAHRPAIVFAPANDGELRGSGRSIAGFHLRDAIDLVSKREPDLVTRFGGHAYAAGLSLRAPDLARFADAFERGRARVAHAGRPRGALRDRRRLRARRADAGPRRELHDGGLGPGLPPAALRRPLRASRASASSAGATRGSRSPAAARRFDAILFGHAEPLPATIDAVVRPGVNRWQGAESVELVVERWLPA